MVELAVPMPTLPELSEKVYDSIPAITPLEGIDNQPEHAHHQLLLLETMLMANDTSQFVVNANMIARYYPGEQMNWLENGRIDSLKSTVSCLRRRGQLLDVRHDWPGLSLCCLRRTHHCDVVVRWTGND